MNEIVEQVRCFLQEDIGTGDLTASIIPEQCAAEAVVITRESMVVCGREWFDAVFSELNSDIQIVWHVDEGEFVQADTELCRLSGQASSLLTGERTALNLLQTLSAVATKARQFASAVTGTRTKILDTRKTIPGLRKALKYAVKCGGCVNHRMGLYDGILIKENHIMATGSIVEAVRLSRKVSSVPVEVEVENLAELRLALTAEPDRIMLDNFSLQDMRRAVTLTNGKIELEASGNISLEKIRIIAGTGVDFISVGALTKNLRAIDLSMRIIMI